MRSSGEPGGWIGSRSSALREHSVPARPNRNRSKCLTSPPLGDWPPCSRRSLKSGQVDIAKSRVRFLASDGLEIASLQDSALRIYPDGGGWAIEGSGGVLALAKAPALNVVSFRSRIQGDVYFLTDAQFRLGETGRISASGEFSSNSKLRIEWNQVDVTLFLDPVWRSRLSGSWPARLP